MLNVNEPEAATTSNSEHPLRKLVQRAQDGDESSLPELRVMLDACPKLWREVGDLAMRSRKMWLEMIAGSDLFTREAIERRLAEMQAELAGLNPTPLEKQLIDRILTCSLQVHYADMLMTKSQSQSEPEQKKLMKCQRAADHRHQLAVKQLATLRKLLPSSEKATKIKLHDPSPANTATDAEADDPLLQGHAEREKAPGVYVCAQATVVPYLDSLLHQLVEGQTKSARRPDIAPPLPDDPYIGPLLHGLMEDQKTAHGVPDIPYPPPDDPYIGPPLRGFIEERDAARAAASQSAGKAPTAADSTVG